MNRTLPAILLASLLLASCAAAPRKRPPAPAPRPRPHTEMVLSSADHGERTVEVTGLAFAYFRRSYYNRAAPRSEEPGGRRLEVADKRRECRCLRMEDWSKVKFRKLRQIEILYPDGAGETQLRLTYRDGRLRVVPASALYGGQTEIPPMLVATSAGKVLEFPLVLPGEPGARWPEETLVRVLFVGP